MYCEEGSFDRRREVIKWIIAGIVLLFCEYVFFRNMIGVDSLFGDRGDGRLTTLLNEHWWRFFNGKEGFSEIAMFYPIKEAFGYTDLFLGYGIIFSFFRVFGVNMFLAYKYTLILIHTFGVISMYYLLRKTLKISMLWSLFGTMAFCFSDSFSLHLLHTQLEALSFLPILLILLIGFIRNFSVRHTRNIYACSFLVIFVMLTYTSWYIACFTGLFSLVFIVVYFIRLKLVGVKPLQFIIKQISPIIKDIAGYILLMVILYIPFIMIYIPVLHSSSGYPYSGCAQYLPEFMDLINIRENNLMMGRVIRKLQLDSRGYTIENKVGFSVILLLVFSVCLFLFYKYKKNKSEKKHSGTDEIIYGEILVSVIITVIICIVSIIRLSANGVSLWLIFYYLIPVTRSLRAIGRFFIWLSFPMSVISAYIADKLLGVKPNLRIFLAVFSVILIFIFNINKVGVSSSWSADEECRFIQDIAVPPKDTEVFYIVDSSGDYDPPFIYQLDAYEIATKYDIKTINGYSGQFPEGWYGIWDLGNDDYEKNIRDWINKYQLTNVYVFDRYTNTWRLLEL